MKEGFRHCFIIRKEYDVLWTIVEGGWNGMSVWNESAEENSLDDLLPSSCKVVECNVREGKGMAHSLGFVSCVMVVKYMLRINKPLLLTPYQLYRWLT